MKINATKKEICELLSKATGIEVTDFSVKKTASFNAQKFIDAVKNLDYLGSQKITAIKAIREVAGYDKNNHCHLTLSNAKWAVENWPQWIAFVKEKGRLPQGEYLYNGILK